MRPTGPARALWGAAVGVMIAGAGVGSLYLLHALGDVIERHLGWVPATLWTMAGTAVVGFWAIWSDR